MYHALGAFVKPSFGTAGSEARATGKRCPVKYALILLSALLVSACGGLTKEQQGTAYNNAAVKYDAAAEEAYAAYKAAYEIVTTDDEGLEAITDLYSSYGGAVFVYIEDLEAIAWTSEFNGNAQSMISCMRETYLLQLEVLSAVDIQEAIDLSEVADEKHESCRSINDSFRTMLGLGPVTE